jgi:cytochrome c peroxidase
MIVSHATPPAMITGIRPSAEVAVRKGFTHIQFTLIEEEHATAVDKYLQSLKPIPSPYLVNGELSEKAQKGKLIFESNSCIHCHTGPYFTDQKTHEIGKQGEYDHQNKWDTPTLIEIWRSGPYLHDGRSATMQEMLGKEMHGLRNALSEEEVDQLSEYVLSL